MVAIRKEISLGTVIQLLGSVAAVIWLAAQLDAGQATMKCQIDRIETRIESISIRLDRHIDGK